MDIQNVGVVGTGMIGRSLAAMFIGNNCKTVLVGRRKEGLEEALKNIQVIFDDFIERGIMNTQHKERALANLTLSTDYEALADTDLVMEAVFEDADLKGSIYKEVERVCRADTIIGSATSAISADRLAEYLDKKERFLVAHPWNPPHMVPLIELVKSLYTSEECAQTLKEFFLSIHKKPVVLQKNIEGFVGNRLQHAMFREALHIIEQGIVTPEELDDVIYYSFGQRYSSMHLLEHYDCAGLPLNQKIEADLFPELCDAKEPQKILLDHIAEGKLGMKTGEGMLNWHGKDMDDFRRRQTEPFYQFVKMNLTENDEKI